MKYVDCFRFLASPPQEQNRRHLRRQFRPGLVGGHPRFRRAAFYLDASMSLSTMFGCGPRAGAARA